MLQCDDFKIETPYGDATLAMPPDVRLNRIKVFDLEGVVQFAMIDALQKSAAKNDCKMSYDAGYDGWYKFKGSIDTAYVARAVAQAAYEKMVYDREVAVQNEGY